MSIITRYAEIDIWAVNRNGCVMGMVHYRPTVLLCAEQTKRSILFNKHIIINKLKTHGVVVDDIDVENFNFELLNGYLADNPKSELCKYVLDARLYELGN